MGRRLALAATWLPAVRQARRILMPLDVLTCSGPLGRDSYVPDRPAGRITTTSGRFFDASRDLGMSWVLHRPEAPEEPMPVVVYATPMDWGGRRRRTPLAGYLGEHLARHGYASLHVHEHDSDRYVFPHPVEEAPDQRAYVRDSIRDGDRGHHRFLDLVFVLDQLESWNRTGPLAGMLDMGRLGMAGHSYGARSTLALLGERIGTSRRSYRDRRIRAGMIYSVAPSVPPDTPESIYEDIDIPVCVMAGGRDFSWDTPSLPSDRLTPFRKMRQSPRYMVMLKGADHLTFPAGRAEAGTANPRERRNHQLIRAISLAFWDAFLLGDETARSWLDRELAAAMKGNGRAESR
jgi:predicted dienelactone hydrolase